MNPKIKIIASAIVIILCAAAILEFAQVKYTNENETISIGKIDVRLGGQEWIEQKPWPTVNPFYRALAWYRSSGGGSNTITSHYYGSFSDYHPPARRTFYAQGRIWYIGWWPSGTLGNIFYTSSTDGITWATPTDTGLRCNRPPVAYYDGTYVHIAYQAYESGSTPLKYIRGTPNSDGTITFGTAQNAIATSSNYIPTSIIADSNGYPWIGYRYSSDGTNWYPYVIKSSKNDGTWTTASGFPYQLSTYADISWMIELVPLTSGKVAAIYTGISRSVYLKSWTGSAWNAAVSPPYTYASPYSYPWVSAVAVGDIVYVAYPRQTASNPTLVKYTYSSNSFSNVMDIESSSTSGNTAFLALVGTNLIYWISTLDGTSYRIYDITANTLSSRTTASTEGTYALMLSVPYSCPSGAPIYAITGVGASDPRTAKIVLIQGPQQTQFQVIVSSLSITGKYVKSKTSGIEGSANVTVKVYHNVDTNSTWVLAGTYNLANDTILPYSTSFSTPWYNLLSGSYSPGSHTYYFKVEVIVQGRDSLTGEGISVSAYTTCSTSLVWQSMMAKMEDMRVLETNMVEQFTLPMYAILLVIVCLGALALVWRRPEKD